MSESAIVSKVWNFANVLRDNGVGTYAGIVERDKTNLDIFWLKDKSLTDLDNLPDPDVLANEIIENIEAGLNSFKEIMETINGDTEE